ncbi:LysR family transcriptional regulator [Janthinobacterium sp. 67]|uniref:LysR family transcriptional regulator n=1 Tax=Janthinobacterium sp. 67 TaxID=2035207 RepID=UPI000C231B74|nr:LysR family transcriptional regulator [Janthinobacterium sp. 67]PJJ06701.1 LysR family transcriptional regulator [Janthinobacterium sp. 67]
MNLNDIDLNLLVVFNQLLLERSVSGAAAKLGVTQPAVSNALKRFRRLMGDDLFLRTSRGMQPTPFAEQLAEPIAYVLSTILTTLNQRQTFDPTASTRKFTIGMTDIGEIYFLPTLMATLAREAPGVTISTVRNGAIKLAEEMDAGNIDLAIGLLPQLKAGYFQRRLFKQRYVCLFRKGHVLDKPGVTLEEFAGADHLMVVSADTGHLNVDEVLERHCGQRRVVLSVPHFVSVGHILQDTDLVSTVPERFARQSLEPFGLSYSAHPVPFPEIAINLFWHARFHKEPGNQWMRGVIYKTFSDFSEDGASSVAPAMPERFRHSAAELVATI